VDRGGLWRAAALEASRSKTPTNGAELGKQSLKTGAPRSERLAGGSPTEASSQASAWLLVGQLVA
jgi:hypothetical protein